MSSSTNEIKHQTSNPILKDALRRFFIAVNDLFPDVNDSIDAGCGEGYGALEMLTNHHDVEMIGIDLSQPAVFKVPEVAPQLTPAVADVTQLPFMDNSTSLITSFEVLEHIPNPERAVQEYRRVTSKYLLASVPNEPLFRLLRMARGDNIRAWGNHPEHVNHWNLITFGTFLEENGFRVIKKTSPFPFIWSIALCEVID